MKKRRRSENGAAICTALYTLIGIRIRQKEFGAAIIQVSTKTLNRHDLKRSEGVIENFEWMFDNDFLSEFQIVPTALENVKQGKGTRKDYLKKEVCDRNYIRNEHFALKYFSE